MPSDQPEVTTDQAVGEPGTEAIEQDVEAAPNGGGLSVENQQIFDPTPVSQRKEVQDQWDAFRRRVVHGNFGTEELLDGVEKVYSTSEAAEFFGRTNRWIYWGLRPDSTGHQVFQYKDGTAIQPERVGPGGRRRFKLSIIREIALSCYRRGNVSEEELTEIMAKILLAEFGKQAFADT